MWECEFDRIKFENPGIAEYVSSHPLIIRVTLNLTKCGKTDFVKRFLHNLCDMCNTRFDRILFETVDS